MAMRASSKLPSVAGWGVSSSTATSVPSGNDGSEPVRATLLTSDGPSSRASVLSGRPS